MKRFLAWIDRRVTGFLLKNPDKVPNSWRKAIAWYYPNAVVRKRYLEYYGVSMGDGTLANVGLIPIPGDGVKAIIGKNVSIAPNVTLVLQSDPNNGQEIRGLKYIQEKAMKDSDIVIEDDAWLGANVTVLPGVTIGRCAVIGAGCVLTHNADAYGIYSGIPGRKVGDVRQWEDGFEQ